MDNGSGKINRFKEAFERGKKGEADSFKAWLEKNSFNPEKFTYEFLSDYFSKHPEEAENREELLEEIGGYAGLFSRNREGEFHLPLSGVSGVGKTQLAFTIEYLTGKADADVSPEIYSAESFSEEGSDQYIYDVTENLAEAEGAFVIVDDCEKDRRIVDSLEKITSSLSGYLLLTLWSPERWSVERDKVEEVTPTSKELRVEPLQKEESLRLLRKLTGKVSEGSPDIEEGFYEKVFETGQGVPRLMITLLMESIRETFFKDLEKGTPETVDMAAERMNLKSVEEKLRGLSTQQLSVLKHILLTTDERGINPGTLVEILNRDKSTVSYHLKILNSRSIIKSEKYGRHVYYRIEEGLVPPVQLKLEKESEFHA